MWDKIKDILGFIFIVGFIGTCTTKIIQSDRNAENIHEQTEYFLITNKDFINTSISALRESYNFVIYFDRYDKNKVYIDCPYDLKRVSVTEYDYYRLKVGELYTKNKVDIMTYGFY